MAKTDYFEMLESLADLVLEAVSAACASCKIDEHVREKKLSELHLKCEISVCELETKLFSDFIPPLQRDSIATYAHSLSRVVDRASDLCVSGVKNRSTIFNGACDESHTREVCIRLAEKIVENTKLLRRLRSPSCVLEVSDFRSTLRQGREASARELHKVRCGVLPALCADSIYGAERLRYELSYCFDKLVEIMLNNI